METGYRLIPHWLMGVAPVALILLILLGGFWMKKLDEKQKREAGRR